MKIEQLHWMMTQLKQMTTVTQAMIDEVRATGGTPDPEAEVAAPAVDENNDHEASYEHVQAAALTLLHHGGRELVQRFVNELNVTSLRSLPKERYAEAFVLADRLREEVSPREVQA